MRFLRAMVRKLQKWFYYTRMKFWCAVFIFHTCIMRTICTLHPLCLGWLGKKCPTRIEYPDSAARYPLFMVAMVTGRGGYHFTCEKHFWFRDLRLYSGLKYEEWRRTQNHSAARLYCHSWCKIKLLSGEMANWNVWYMAMSE